MNKTEITKLLAQHGTAEQVNWVAGLDDEDFKALEADIKKDQAGKAEAINGALSLLAKTIDESGYSDYVMFRAMYKMLDLMRQMMPVFKDQQRAVESVEVAESLIAMGAVMQSVRLAVEGGMGDDGDTDIEG